MNWLVNVSQMTELEKLDAIFALLDMFLLDSKRRSKLKIIKECAVSELTWIHTLHQKYHLIKDIM